MKNKWKSKFKMIRKIVSLLLTILCLNGEAQCKDIFLLVGTYSPTMYVYRFNPVSGELEPTGNLNISGSQYLTVSKNQKFVYVANDQRDVKGGEITALSFDNGKGTLDRINSTTTGSEPCCFVDISADDKWVAAGNYRLGNLCIFKTNSDGSIQPCKQIIDHKTIAPTGAVPHVHCTLFSPDGKYVFATDLGLDKLFCYPFSPQSDLPLLENEGLISETPNGYGPRHLVFHPSGKYLYMIAEKSGHIVCYQYKTGKLIQIQDLLSDSTNNDGKGGSADIHITPNGKFLYATHRLKANDIVGYKIASSGKLTELFHQSSMGIQPRNFVIDPTGSFLLVANVDSGNIVVFKINRESGRLSATGEGIKVGKPFCLKMIE